jgi:hypothetical protein
METKETSKSYSPYLPLWRNRDCLYGSGMEED